MTNRFEEHQLRNSYSSLTCSRRSSPNLPSKQRTQIKNRSYLMARQRKFCVSFMWPLIGTRMLEGNKETGSARGKDAGRGRAR